MSRTGVEAKPPWKSVPWQVRRQIETALGAPVKRAARVWGGYGPAPTYRLTLADGRRAFFKGTFLESNEFAISALIREERIYGELGDRLQGWIPEMLACVREQDWHVLLLEDLGAKTVPPWTRTKARSITHALADFHQATYGAVLPGWLSSIEDSFAPDSFRHVREESQDFHTIAALAGEDAPGFLAWLQNASPIVDGFVNSRTMNGLPQCLLHGDLRSDNLRYLRGRLVLFDLPFVSVGRPEYDMVAFAQSVTVERGSPPEQVMNWYEARFPVNQETVDRALARIIVMFADRAWRPEIPELPRLRRFQCQQLAALLAWAARRWSLPVPPFVVS